MSKIKIAALSVALLAAAWFSIGQARAQNVDNNGGDDQTPSLTGPQESLETFARRAETNGNPTADPNVPAGIEPPPAPPGTVPQPVIPTTNFPAGIDPNAGRVDRPPQPPIPVPAVPVGAPAPMQETNPAPEDPAVTPPAAEEPGMGQVVVPPYATPPAAEEAAPNDPAAANLTAPATDDSGAENPAADPAGTGDDGQYRTVPADDGGEDGAAAGLSDSGDDAAASAPDDGGDDAGYAEPDGFDTGDGPEGE